MPPRTARLHPRGSRRRRSGRTGRAGAASFGFPFSSLLPAACLRLARRLAALQPAVDGRDEARQLDRRAGGEEEPHHRDGPRRFPRPLERDDEQEEVEKVDAAPDEAQASARPRRRRRRPCSTRTSRSRPPGSARRSTSGCCWRPSPRPPGDHVERREQPAVAVRVQAAEDETREARHQRGEDPRPAAGPTGTPSSRPPGRGRRRRTRRRGRTPSGTSGGCSPTRGSSGETGRSAFLRVPK